jgi:hypothetical protein
MPRWSRVARLRRDDREAELAERRADVVRILARRVETLGAVVRAVADDQRDAPLGRLNPVDEDSRQHHQQQRDK